MRRWLITCDYCRRDIGFDAGDGKLLWEKVKYSNGVERDLCQKCFERVNRTLTEIRNENDDFREEV